MDPRGDKSRRNWRLIAQAKIVMQKERDREEKTEARAKQRLSVDKKNFAVRRAIEDKKLEDDATRAYMDR